MLFLRWRRFSLDSFVNKSRNKSNALRPDSTVETRLLSGKENGFLFPFRTSISHLILPIRFIEMSRFRADGEANLIYARNSSEPKAKPFGFVISIQRAFLANAMKGF